MTMEKKKKYQTPLTEIVMIDSVSPWLDDKTFTVDANKTVDEEASNSGNIWDNNEAIWNSEE